MGRKGFWLIILLQLTQLGCRDLEDIVGIRTKGLPPTQNLSTFDEQGEELERRLLTEFTTNGYVTSKEENGELAEFGDSLLWTGLALGALPCDRGLVMFEALEKTAEAYDGGFVRFQPLPQEYENDPTSRDMEVGAMFGLILHLKHCQQKKPVQLLAKHFQFIRQQGGKLFSHGDSTKININPAFQYFLNVISHKALRLPQPLPIDAATFEGGLISNASFIAASKDNCYPVHLSTLQLITLAIAGYPASSTTKSAFCAATQSLKLPLTDWYCSRLDVAQFLDAYELNKYSYVHQRCLAWEEATPKNEPALDWIVLKRLADGSIY